jgi:chromosome segregation ATPase
MAADRAAELLALVRELEREDADLAARLDIVVGLIGRVDQVRDRSRRVLRRLEALPNEIARAMEGERDARQRTEEAEAELAEAERRLDEVSRSRRAGNEAKAEAERAVKRLTVAAADASATVLRMEEHVQALANDEVELGAEAAELAVEAQELAREVAEVPSLSESGRAAPGRSLEEIDEWGARAHAALFVVRGGLESQREKVVLEANLAAGALGDPAGVSVALVRRMLEQSLAQPAAE